MGVNDPQGEVAANLKPRGMVGRINVVNYYASLRTTYRSCRLYGIREDFFKVIPHYTGYVKSIEANDLRAWSIWTAGAWLA